MVFAIFFLCIVHFRAQSERDKLATDMEALRAKMRVMESRIEDQRSSIEQAEKMCVPCVLNCVKKTKLLLPLSFFFTNVHWCNYQLDVIDVCEIMAGEARASSRFLFPEIEISFFSRRKDEVASVQAELDAIRKEKAKLKEEMEK